MVEVDPYDPQSVPVKRTGLGRFRHEAAGVVVNPDGRVVVYLGEDRAWGYVFRFVSNGRYDAAKGVENGALLDDGTLSVARFDETGVTWLPLIHGQGKLIAPEFPTAADVLIDARRAAQAVGGTPMDRPEDVEVSPVSGNVFVNLTRNNDRKAFAVDAANPRPENEDGHILQMIPPAGKGGPDHAADVFAWNVFLIAGPVEEGGVYGAGGAAVLSGPDNLAFDPQGRLWIATDNRRWAALAKPIPNGLFACQVEGPERATTRLFFNVPAGAEACGPEFTPDGQTLFLAIQHPGEDVSPKPAKGWPDFAEGVPARPSVVAVTRKGGGPIGG
jgi:secreted PhoX family phosphatase